ncbi:hypothetical protein GCM10009837_06640 [Streptomyces durmitorensis]|uniref:MarR family transcriptional regulator n=1 Tax=Streptomyces durmitorensis TaxID=319947 RepID=A0ABY4PM38_9ACTN|nr:hypothetical protein [Streptomyces durmitorensis]UQT54440.1 hypothetical protein M4V62_04660 [Streptomyces durmitorensis]
MNRLNLDAGLAVVVDAVREAHAPIAKAFAERQPVTIVDFAALHGAVTGLLSAIDARTPAQAKGVAA